EAGREAIGKGGLLRNPADAERLAEDLRAWLDGVPGRRAIGCCASPIEGGDGTRDFLLGGGKARWTRAIPAGGLAPRARASPRRARARFSSPSPCPAKPSPPRARRTAPR